MFAKGTHFKKVAGKKKVALLMLYSYSKQEEETRPKTEEETFLISINDISNFVPRKHLD